MGKTRQTEQKVELPPEIKKQALENMDIAKQVGQLPYAPNFGLQVAALSPGQEASMANTADAASAFGLPSGGGTGMPTPQNVGGMRGYSTEGMYNDAMSRVDPRIMAMYKALFGPPPEVAAASHADPTSRHGISGTGGKAGKQQAQIAASR